MAYYSTQDDISFIPLTVEEERAYFKTFYDAELSADSRREARNELILRHLKFVAKIAIACSKRALEDEEAISAGNRGLIKALQSKSFKPELGFRFSSYVRSYIRSAVFAAMRERSTRRIPDQFATPFFAADATITGHISHQQPVTGSGMSNALEFSEEHAFEAEDLHGHQCRMIEQALSRLNKLEAATVRLYSLEGWTFDEIAAERKVSRQSCHQIYNKAMKKLRTILSAARKELR